jgi:hypothetical protein
MSCESLRNGYPADSTLFDRKTLSGIVVRLTVDGTRYLSVLVSSDGTLERGGRGEHEFATRLADYDLFSQVVQKVSPDVLRWAGQSWSDPHPKGKTCELLIALRDGAGCELASRWTYGTESPEPPKEIRDFVLEVVETTNPWYRRQIELRQKRPRSREGAAWRLVPLVPTGEANMEGVK